MIINPGDIDIPAETRIYYAIPEDVRDLYKVRSMNGGEYFIISDKFERVAFVSPLSEGRFDFTYYPHTASSKFERIMESARKGKVASELRWVVLVAGKDKCWERIGVLEISENNALSWIGIVHDRKLMVLASFVASEVVGTFVKTRSANYVTYVDRRLEVNKSNMGAVGFQVSNWLE